MKKDNQFLPKRSLIREIRKETPGETSFRLTFEDGSSLGQKPGQFIILSILGVGEAPFSITSSPNDPEGFEICVRAVGKVTKALHRLPVGSIVGIRGPFGTDFDKSEYAGKDVVFIAGGIGLVPLRSAVLDCINDRENYKSMTLLYGAKSKKDMVYHDGVAKWHQEGILDADIILDNAEGTDYKQGLITVLIDQRTFTPDTQFVICGPPIMYRFIIKSLKTKGVSESDIWVSLERHMKCGVGRCGHCRMDDVCICQEGPVFRYDQVSSKRGVL